ncbi:hypothetical protein NPIL_685681 [Nephila pilipes]|uniref:Uncharacterized protein n=1 Tax=Nephila pilipes TaxID=299642 RepID=A0A8X6PE16_NEPPI|nr:hypothetical protein NPIL_685681 [Nephila pilipes]
MLQVITEERVAKEAAALLEAENLRKALVLAAEKENVEKQQKYELEKLQLQLECQRLSALDAQSSTENSQGINKLPNFELNNFSTLLPKFDPKKELGIFFNVFERQAKFMKLLESSWIPYLIGTLPSDIASLIVREPE